MAPDANTIYYAFSTIAQALAAIFGILAAFAIMRLSELSARLVAELRPLSGYCRYPEAFSARLADGDFDAALSQVDKEAIEGSDDSLILAACERVAGERRDLNLTIRRSLVLTGLVITYAAGSLLLANWIVVSERLTWLCLVIGFIGLALSLIIVGTLLFTRRTRPRRQRRVRVG